MLKTVKVAMQSVAKHNLYRPTLNVNWRSNELRGGGAHLLIHSFRHSLIHPSTIYPSMVL